MSYQRQQPGQPSDLSDESPNRNPEFVEKQPYKEGYMGKKAGRRCVLCTKQYDRKLDKCPDCGCSAFTSIEPKFPVDIIPMKDTAQFRRRVEVCWNQRENVEGEVSKHQFVEVKIPVISVIPIIGAGVPTTDYEIHDEVRCKTCGMPYQRINGRHATPEEIQRFKDGKIERASKFLGQNWVA